ncbi:hypothetical protein EC973_006103 [Apophysomyces ossiformis]|uniref:Uncharacterized protein n=1 Tax=Apophysomyces ossiformis TaxID=679940 RepID=A0A8H7ERU1_9FUNG|nr:hypothetical protein EC973_006103 [Apophysomyces ossiformis]
MDYLFRKNHKEHKSVKLQKKLQLEEDKQWKAELERRKQQELKDEALAKELQAQLEAEAEEQRHTPIPSPTITTPTSPRTGTSFFVESVSPELPMRPPPLPAKPIAYHSGHSITSSTDLSQTPSIPSASLASVSTPSLVRSVPPPPYNTTPSLHTPALPPRNLSTTDLPHTPPPLSVPHTQPNLSHIHNSQTSSSSSSSSSSSLLPIGQRRESYLPPSHELNSQPTVSASTNAIPVRQRKESYLPPPQESCSAPIVSSQASQPHILDNRSPQHHNSYNSAAIKPSAPFPAHVVRNDAILAPAPHPSPIPPSYLPVSPASVSQSMPHLPLMSMPEPSVIHKNKPSVSTAISPVALRIPERSIAPSNDLHRRQSKVASDTRFTNSTQVQKPDEDLSKNEPRTEIYRKTDDSSDSDSGENFVYKKTDNVILNEPETKSTSSHHDLKARSVTKNEEEDDDGTDPFADSFAVEVSDAEKEDEDEDEVQAVIVAKSTLQADTNKWTDDQSELVDSRSPTTVNMQARLANLLKASSIDQTDAYIKDEKTQQSEERSRRCTIAIVTPHIRSQSMGAFSTQAMQTPRPVLESPTSYDDTTLYTQQVYPTSVLRAGAPPFLNGSSPETHGHAVAIEVPENEYGYYKADDVTEETEQETAINKALPTLPKTDPNHRHITVPSINEGQRVWIRVHPTDTGKALAQRIHVVATYQTRKILKLQTATGRIVPLDETPVFTDWCEISRLKDGEPWRVEWGLMDNHLIDVLEGGKEFMRSLKATLRSEKEK